MPDGGYDSRNGYIYTFKMTINTPQGPMVGEIGSKQQNYPANMNDTITVEVTDSEYGPKFKKVNPQYSGQQGGGQQQHPQTQQGGRGGGKKDDKVQLYIIRQSSVRSAVEFYRATDGATEDNVLAFAAKIEEYVTNGKKTAGVTQGQQQSYNQAGLNYDPNQPPPATDDDIPF